MRTIQGTGYRGIVLALVAGVFCISCNDQEPLKPNIVLILADDMGYGDIRAFNVQSGIETPHMDRIAQEGMIFTDAHSGSGVCTPTRYGILTGRYAWRSSLKSGVLWGYDPPMIEDDRPTVALKLAEQGYRTAVIGKWHLGLGWSALDDTKPIEKYDWQRTFTDSSSSNVDYSQYVSGPAEAGFQESYIVPASLDMTPYLYLVNGYVESYPSVWTPGKQSPRGVFWRSGEVSPDFAFDGVLDRITDRAVQYINGSPVSQPFFLYVPLTAPHTPWVPTAAYQGTSQAGIYGDFVSQVDATVGKIYQALEQANQLENTLFIVTSDNGADWNAQDKEQFTHRANYIYRGRKADIYEGGHRVPLMVKWPGHVEAGSSTNTAVCLTDFFATFSELIRTDKPAEAEDSYSFLPLLQGQNSTSRPYTIHHSLNGFFAIRKGPWKLTPHLGSGGFTQPAAIEAAEGEPVGTLYNLDEDPGESINLYKTHPEIVSELMALLEREQRKR